jgi:hypothetical protein
MGNALLFGDLLGGEFAEGAEDDETICEDVVTCFTNLLADFGILRYMGNIIGNALPWIQFEHFLSSWKLNRAQSREDLLYVEQLLQEMMYLL